jgi:hypothetical protein
VLKLGARIKKLLGRDSPPDERTANTQRISEGDFVGPG